MIFYDIETLKGPDEVEDGWDNPEAMGFGSAVAYDSVSDLYHFFSQDKSSDLVDLLRNQTVVTFNGVKFDNRVLLGNNYRRHELLWRDEDLLLWVIQYKFSLDSVAEAESLLVSREVHDGSISLNGLAKGTLQKKKTSHGSQSPIMIREKRWSELWQYNLQDVRLLRQLREFLDRYKFLVDGKGSVIRFS